MLVNGAVELNESAFSSDRLNVAGILFELIRVKHHSTLLLNLLIHLFFNYSRGVSDAVFATAQNLACINALYIATDRRTAEFLEAQHDGSRIRHRLSIARKQGRDHDRADERTARPLHGPHAGPEAGAETQQLVLALAQLVGKGDQYRLTTIHFALALRGVVFSFLRRHTHVALPLHSWSKSR